MSAAFMVQGVSSDAGKSLVVTGLCRWLNRRGVRVAPFKAQNMSNNARVTRWGEIGSAQWLQALAAGAEPDIRMNPVLLKPESDTRSQVVLNGRVDQDLTRTRWRGRSQLLWPHVEAAYRSLCEEFDVIVIEGAGSPAETNLWDDDIVNMRMADLADAPVLLVADIDRGGAFAHLYGTWALLRPAWRSRIEGFLLNKFRGDAALLAPAPDDLRHITGVPTVGVLPFLNHGLPDEEGPTPSPPPNDSRTVVCVVAGPYASNLDEFARLQQVADVRFVRAPASLGDADLIVLPGSKHAARDLAWFRDTRLDRGIRAAAARGTPILGICGGLQQLGHTISDPHGVEGACDGLGLLDIDTTYQAAKRTATTTIVLPALDEPWQWLSNHRVSGYEIRHGTTTTRSTQPICSGLAYIHENILGLYLHGIFEDDDVLTSLAAAAPPLHAVFDQLADAIDQYVDRDWLSARTSP